MQPLGLSGGFRKASEQALRALSLASARPRMVAPVASRPVRPHDAVLVLGRGRNASIDYYLRPRLRGETVPVVYADIDDDPRALPLIAEAQALTVIVCRYVSPPWLEAFEAMGERLARFAFFMDDDMPAMQADPALPAATRGKIAAHMTRHVPRLSRLASEVWVSNETLVARYPEARARAIAAVPEGDPAAPAPATSRRVIYHGTDAHPAERAFVLDLARRLEGAGLDWEIAGDAALRDAAGLAGVEVVPQRPWPDFLAAQTGRSAALALAPLFQTPVNCARAPVKAFDAARLGALGLYADIEPFAGFVRHGEDGLLLPMRPEAWTDAILALIADPARRAAMTAAMAARLSELRARADALPPAPAA